MNSSLRNSTSARTRAIGVRASGISIFTHISGGAQSVRTVTSSPDVSEGRMRYSESSAIPFPAFAALSKLVEIGLKAKKS